MTTAAFIAACFWPLVVLFVVLLTSIKDDVLYRYLAIAASVVASSQALEIDAPRS